MNLKLSLSHIIRVLVRLAILGCLVQYYGPELIDAVCVSFLVGWSIGYFECVFDKAEDKR